MNKRDLKQVYYIKKEITMWQEKLKELEDISLKSPKLDGMPRAAGKSDPTANRAEEIAEAKEIIEELEYRTLKEAKRIYEYIRDIDDSLLRQIIIYRCVELKTWAEVADSIGGGNTEDSVRKRYERHFS